VQVDPIKPNLKPPGTERLKLNCDVLLSTSDFKFNLRRHIKGHQTADFGIPIFTKDQKLVEILLNATTRRDGGAVK